MGSYRLLCLTLVKLHQHYCDQFWVFRKDEERLDSDLQKTNQTARVRITWQKRLRGWACLARQNKS